MASAQSTKKSGTAPVYAAITSDTSMRGGFWVGLVLLIALTLLTAEIDRWIAASFRAQGVASNPLEYPLTAVIIGLIANLILRVLRLHDYIRPALRTEFFLKVGLVLLGARISLGDLFAIGAGGLIQAVIMVSSVFMFTWWLGGRMKIEARTKAVMASAVSICGVSAAIAAAGAVQAKREQVTYITTLVILTALPLMVLMPTIAHALGLSPAVAGGWFGGNIDTTAAVVGAGTIYGSEAQSVAAVVKLAQNVLIGFVSFALALYFSVVVERGQGERPTPKLIWERFPKFVLGFILVSVLASLGAFSAPLVKEVNTAMQWLFALAFVCIGLEFSLTDLRKAGWKPVLVYMGATVFNTLLALIVASVIFGNYG
ncbi:MAG: putative sulfate exporter family transporter [Anaerolineae bacterium]|nr:putative sulfate exporter family transporter [Anaerolineae bacterium]